MLGVLRDLKKNLGKWDNTDGLINLHSSACSELPTAYDQLSESAKAELFAVFQLTELREWVQNCKCSLSFYTLSIPTR